MTDLGDSVGLITHVGTTADVLTAQGRATMTEPQYCPACHEVIRDGELLYQLIREKHPWLPEDHDEQDWDVIEWHIECDKGSMTAGEIECRAEELLLNVAGGKWSDRPENTCPAGVVDDGGAQ